MPKHTWLVRIKGRYYFRRRVPLDIVEAFGKREVKIALGTSDCREADRLVLLKALEVDQKFEAAWRGQRTQRVNELPEAEVDLIARQTHQEELARHERQLREDPRFDPETVKVGLDQELSDWVDGLRENEWNAETTETVKAVLATHGYTMPPNGSGFAVVRRRIARGITAANRMAYKRAEGDYSFVFDDPLSAQVAPGDRSSPIVAPQVRAAPQVPAGVRPDRAGGGVTLAELIEKYMNDPQRAHLAPRHKISYAIVLRALNEIVGPDNPARQITRADCRRVRDILATLPLRSKQRFPKLTLVGASALGAKRSLPAISTNTATSYLRSLSALFRWAVREEYIERNPAEGLSVAGKRVEAKDMWKPFTTEQLVAIFNAPIYTGCLNDGHGWNYPGPNRPRRGRFWVPLISLWGGSSAQRVLPASCRRRAEGG